VHIPKLAKVSAPTDKAVTDTDAHRDHLENVEGFCHGLKSNVSAQARGAKSVNREAELKAPSRVACSELLGDLS
jgi:hypothetical protein